MFEIIMQNQMKHMIQKLLTPTFSSVLDSLLQKRTFRFTYKVLYNCQIVSIWKREQYVRNNMYYNRKR